MAVALSVLSRVTGTLTTARDGGNAIFPVDETAGGDVADGVGVGQANAIYVDDFSIAASGTLNIDLSGTLTDAHGNTLVFTGIKSLFIKADSTNVNNIVVGNGANPFVGPFGAGAHTLALKPGGFIHVSDGFSAAGWAVTAGTGDILMLTNSAAGTAVTGTIVVTGKI